MPRIARKTVRVAVAKIKANKDRPAKAHRLEDELYLMILEAVAADEQPSGELAILAQEALKSQKIEFTRICT